MKVKALIEKLSMAVVGEEPETVIDVLSCFTLSILERFDVPLEDYIRRMRQDDGLTTRKSKSTLPD